MMPPVPGRRTARNALAVVATVSVLVALSPVPVRSSEARPVTAAEKRQALSELARLLRSGYAVAETAERAAVLIEKNAAAGAYDGLTEARAFAEAVTRDLRSVTGDTHLRFGLPTAPSARPSDPAVAEADQAFAAAAPRRANFGLPRAEILPGNVGVLEVRRFQPPDQAGDTIAAAVAFLAQADAVIVDLRNCRGGSAWVMPIFAGYFLPRPTSLYTMFFRGDGFTERFWSAAWLPGKKLAGVPMYILTSAYTFSGAEGLAYRFQVLKRAVVVGETTGGGANAGGVRDVGPVFKVWLPMGRPIDADTGTNWEGSGVVPDIKAAARDALPVAHLAAIEGLRAGAKGERDRARLDAAAEWADARLHPVVTTVSDLERLAGAFGTCRVWVEGGQLRIRRADEAPFLLLALSASVFVSETNQPVRVEFWTGPDGRAAKLAFTDEDGLVEEHHRSASAH